MAAKALVWVAIGLGMWVLPEAARHAADGLDARTVLLRALAIIGALAVCALAVFAAVPGLLLRTAFGPDYESGAGVLLTLGCAYALLAASYLAVQFLLGVAGRTFALVLAAVAVAEPLLLLAGRLAARLRGRRARRAGGGRRGAARLRAGAPAAGGGAGGLT